MNYELAKQLKDAGYPVNLEDNSDNSPFYPNLSELIEACGDTEMVLNVIDGKYTNARFIGKEFNGEGSTPEEAVFRLYLALNK